MTRAVSSALALEVFTGAVIRVGVEPTPRARVVWRMQDVRQIHVQRLPVAIAAAIITLVQRTAPNLYTPAKTTDTNTVLWETVGTQCLVRDLIPAVSRIRV